MSRKTNTQRGGKKAKNNGGGGLSKHRSSGVAHNHANSISRVREENKRLEAEAKLREKRKGKMYPTVKEALNNL